MDKEFVTYELSLRMKAIEFDEPCFAFYQEEYTIDKPVMVDDDAQYRVSGFRTCKNSEIPEHFTAAPTWQSAFAWFRKEYGLSGWINESFSGSSRQGVISIKSEIGLKYHPATTKFFDTYEEAQQACLEKLIEIVEEKQK